MRGSFFLLLRIACHSKSWQYPNTSAKAGPQSSCGKLGLKLSRKTGKWPATASIEQMEPASKQGPTGTHESTARGERFIFYALHNRIRAKLQLCIPNSLGILGGLCSPAKTNHGVAIINPHPRDPIDFGQLALLVISSSARR